LGGWSLELNNEIDRCIILLRRHYSGDIVTAGIKKAVSLDEQRQHNIIICHFSAALFFTIIRRLHAFACGVL
jgi:hypothetical protein